MDQFDQIFKKHNANIEQIEKEHKESIEQINKEYNKKMNKINKTFTLLSVLIIIFFLRFNFIFYMSTRFEKYASVYSLKIYNKTTYDSDIIYDKIKPESWIVSFLDITKWTEYQISKNKELYIKCSEEYIKKEKQEEIDYNEALKTIDERIKIEK